MKRNRRVGNCNKYQIIKQVISFFQYLISVCREINHGKQYIYQQYFLLLRDENSQSSKNQHLQLRKINIIYKKFYLKNIKEQKKNQNKIKRSKHLSIFNQLIYKSSIINLLINQLFKIFFIHSLQYYDYLLIYP
ncbi:hypothetical protein TTHERM_001256582 (macronuclear) [Tetrahymena thermophila SB210]|uniref:Uncharacterized protein n=1 Tax=Tetrahymena thermophila (strain SB210) TaxID=312017 RepID=W7X6M9_TETTS|nr:hypothetical protein TTHERM_001256582 [Tetrahymena thermophila SB210]EWS75035.1 hypothetical protein TTHERM_001256582 [Tetrahymena thermophila SB210]|eukprot:XP_012652434.1 hypothetical protein TTHERM_001256582 [Tetrahymena thermophila SB210]